MSAAEIEAWLDSLELPKEYAAKLAAAGFDKLAHILTAKFTHSLLKEEVGILVLAHRMRILAAIEQAEGAGGAAPAAAPSPGGAAAAPASPAGAVPSAEDGFASITKLCNNVTFCCDQLLTGSPATMLAGAQQVSQGCSPLVQAAKAIAPSLAVSDAVAHQRVIDAVGEIATSTQQLVAASQNAASGAPAARKAAVDITMACGSLIWAAHHKPSAMQQPLQQHSQSLINYAKAVNDACMCLMSGAKTTAAASDPDSCERVIAAAKATALASQEMMTAAKDASQFILKGQVDPIAQESLLVAARSVGSATALLVRNAQAASLSTGVDNQSHTQLLTFAAKSVADAVSHLVTASTTASEAVPSLARREARNALRECKDAIALVLQNLNTLSTQNQGLILATQTLDITVSNVAHAARSAFEREVDQARKTRSLEIAAAATDASRATKTSVSAVAVETDKSKREMLAGRCKSTVADLQDALAALVERQLQDDLYDSASEFLASAKDLVATARTTAQATAVPLEAQVAFIQEARPTIEGARLLEGALYAPEDPRYRENLAVAAGRMQNIAAALLAAARVLLSKGTTTQSNPTAAQSLITSITCAATATTKLQSAATATA